MIVQTMKLGLKKALSERAASDRDVTLPYVAMGYRMTILKSLGYSHYYVLFGRHPIFPAKIQECENQQVPNLDDPEVVRPYLDARGNAFQEVMPLAMRNLAIAQHRDKARFRRVRGGTGGWDRPKTEVKEGDFVLLKRQVLGV